MRGKQHASSSGSSALEDHRRVVVGAERAARTAGVGWPWPQVPCQLRPYREQFTTLETFGYSCWRSPALEAGKRSSSVPSANHINEPHAAVWPSISKLPDLCGYAKPSCTMASTVMARSRRRR